MIKTILDQLTGWQNQALHLPDVPVPSPENMQYTTLGKTGLNVSVMGLGSGGRSRLGLSRGSSQREAIAIVHHALGSGINLIDTAESYGTEKIIGKAIQATPRDNVILSSKKQLHRKKGGLIDARALRKGLNRSLKALKTDYIDIYHLHGVKVQEYDLIVENLMPTLESLKTEGKIRYIGVTESFSKDPSHQMLSRAVDDDYWDVIMAGFNMINQTARKYVFPKASEKGIGILGMFAVRNALRSSEGLQKIMDQLQTQHLIDKSALGEEFFLKQVMADTSVSIPDMAYRYCRHEPHIETVMFGTGNLAHLQANIHSLLSPAIPEEISTQIKNIFGDISTLSGN